MTWIILFGATGLEPATNAPKALPNPLQSLVSGAIVNFLLSSAQFILINQATFVHFYQSNKMLGLFSKPRKVDFNESLKNPNFC